MNKHIQAIISGLIILILSIPLTMQAQCTINVAIQQFPDTICSGTSFTLSASVGTSGVTYLWSGPNSFSGTSQNEVITNASSVHSGTYMVVASKTGCPSDSDTVTITVHVSPATPTILSNAPICIGDTLRITTVPVSSQVGLTPFIWGPAGYSDTLFVSNIPNAAKANTGLYEAVVTDTFGCTSDTGRFTILPNRINTRPATPVATGAATLCKGDTLKLSATAIQTGETYNWSGPNAQYYNTQNVVSNNYNIIGKQYFILTVDSNGCHSIADTVEMEVRPTANPKVSISASPGYFVGIYTPVTLTANAVDTGTTVVYQWKKNGQDIVGAGSKTYNIIVGTDFLPGDFVSAWILTGPTCAGTDTALSPLASFTINTGINETSGDNNISIYPNPVKDMLTVTGIQAGEELLVTTSTGMNINLQGKVTRGNNTATINTGHLQPGIYFLHKDSSVVRFVKIN